MNYDPQTWQDEILTGEERFTIKDDAGNVLNDNVQIALKTPVLQAGSDVTASRMNHMEAGIANAGKGFYQAFTRISVSETDPNPPDINPGTNLTTVYVHPYNGNTYPQWNGIKFEPVEFSLLPLFLEESINLAGVYDVFLWQDGETVRAVFGTKWTTSGDRGTGLGTAELETLNGVSVNKNSMTVNNGTYSYTMPARMGTFIGTVMAYAAGRMLWYETSRLVWNKYNKLPQIIQGQGIGIDSESFGSFFETSQCFLLVGEPQMCDLTYIAHITQYDAGTAVYKCWICATNYHTNYGVIPTTVVYTPEFSGITSTIIKTTTTFRNRESITAGYKTIYSYQGTTAGTAALWNVGSKLMVELEM